jgi:protein SCO1/2
VATLITLALFSAAGWAQGMGAEPPGMVTPPANQRPPGLAHVAIEQHLNDQIPADLEFRDETGRTVRLGDYFGKRPLIMSLVYYTCPMLCGEVLQGMNGTMKAMSLDAGKDYDVLTVSFDPHDTPADATKKKADFVHRYGRPGAEEGWHFLTGSQSSIDELTKVAGFGYQWDPQTNQYAHGTAIMILTPQGKISQYYYGVEYPPKDVRLGLIQASDNKIGNVVDQVMLYCFHYDPSRGKYGAIISRVLRIAGAATVLIIGTFMFVMFRIGSPHNKEQRTS